MKNRFEGTTFEMDRLCKKNLNWPSVLALNTLFIHLVGYLGTSCHVAQRAQAGMGRGGQVPTILYQRKKCILNVYKPIKRPIFIPNFLEATQRGFIM